MKSESTSRFFLKFKSFVLGEQCMGFFVVIAIVVHILFSIHRLSVTPWFGATKPMHPNQCWSRRINPFLPTGAGSRNSTLRTIHGLLSGTKWLGLVIDWETFFGPHMLTHWTPLYCVFSMWPNRCTTSITFVNKSLKKRFVSKNHASRVGDWTIQTRWHCYTDSGCGRTIWW